MAWTLPISVAERRLTLSRWDLFAVLLVLGVMVFFAEASRHLLAPLSELKMTPISLDPANLPEYAARTTLRMLAALMLSLVFTFTYATLAARNKHAELVLVPLLDILQSVPILGFISVTVVFFMSLAPGRVLGAEFAAVFAIFTSQAWNMAFSFYQSLRTVPVELVEASRVFRLSPWMRFWRLDVPFAMPQLIFNMMMSMSGSWFFVVASEAISVGNTTITLPGVGSYIALAIEQRSLSAIGWAIGTMLIVILLYDQLLFRPLVAWADRFRFEQEAGALPPKSWVLTVLRRSGAVETLGDRLSLVWRRSFHRGGAPAKPMITAPDREDKLFLGLWRAVVLLVVLIVLWEIGRFIVEGVNLAEIAKAVLLGLATLLRVTVLIAIASLIWVPIGVADRHPAAPLQRRAAGRAVPRGVSGEPAVPDRRVGDRRVPARSRHLAEPADDPRHPVVHPVQRHRRRHRHSGRSCATSAPICRCAAGCGGAGSPCPPSSPTT